MLYLTLLHADINRMRPHGMEVTVFDRIITMARTAHFLPTTTRCSCRVADIEVGVDLRFTFGFGIGYPQKPNNNKYNGKCRDRVQWFGTSKK